MVNIKDIYFKIDSKLVAQNFWDIRIDEKKNLIDKELKIYILSKLEELNKNFISQKSQENFSIIDLLNILKTYIPQDEQLDSLSPFIHYILQVSGSLQGRSIGWWIEDDPTLEKLPLIEFNEQGLWSELKTHKNTDCIQLFNFVYDTFTNSFMTKNNPKQLVITRSENEG